MATRKADIVGAAHRSVMDSDPGESSLKTARMTAVLDSDGRVAGIFTDGDLRRLLERGPACASWQSAEVMTATR